MVHKAFREALGETATQAGSENAPGRFRFDFPASGSVPDSVMHDVESRVNSLLLENLLITAQEMSQPEAKAMGAMALFGEKYGERVRVVSVGDWARELCGGTHVTSSAEIGLVKLLGESSIGAGVRRVEALVGYDAFQYLAKEHLLLNSLTQLIKGSRPEELPEKISALLEKLRAIEKELVQLKSAQALAGTTALVAHIEKIGELSVLVVAVSNGLTGEDLKTMALDLRNRIECSVIALLSNSEDRVTLVVATDERSRALGAKAGSLVKIGSTVLGGGGGGRDDFAQGGGVNPAKINDAVSELKVAIRSLAGK